MARWQVLDPQWQGSVGLLILVGSLSDAT